MNPPDFLRSDGQSTARGRRYTSAPGQAIVRRPEYAACGWPAGPLTQDRPMSHQDRSRAGGGGPAQGGITGMAEPVRARPKPTPETQHFWDGTQAGGEALRPRRAPLSDLF